ncbi:helix-turn-helix domain-containing protein [Paraburkholderia sp. SIMBA_053]|uniref:helix-turn-helix domain-containing protein n=1 Tax=Paraburkholderia sp. SIMBA_053 TaxID=3085794 RepID=UPI00397C82E6
MSTDAKISPSIADAVQLARVRMDEMFGRVGASLPSDVRRELSAGVEAILVDVLSRHPAWRHDTDDFLSIAEAATLLFVSRPHISKLLEQGKLELHHEKGSDRFVTKASVLEYWATREAAVEAYKASTSDEK